MGSCFTLFEGTPVSSASLSRVRKQKVEAILLGSFWAPEAKNETSSLLSPTMNQSEQTQQGMDCFAGELATAAKLVNMCQIFTK
jgi:hypothetical protein